MKKYKKLAKTWQDEELKKIPLQPFEDYYKTTRAFEAGFIAAHKLHMAFHEKEYEDGRQPYEETALNKILEEEVDE